jgi:hypothetical protein
VRVGGREPEDWMDTGGLFVGDANGMGLAWELNDEETLAEQHALVDALEKKRPCGFAPWPKELT